jgi:hypothetical protein
MDSETKKNLYVTLGKKLKNTETFWNWFDI